MQKTIILSLCLILILSGCQSTSQSEDLPAKLTPIACTEEAKVCPDGSYVSRTGSLCEFATCPEDSPKTNHTNESKINRDNIICTDQYEPVCGEANNESKTFSNKCYAEAEDATNITEGECEEVKLIQARTLIPRHESINFEDILPNPGGKEVDTFYFHDEENIEWVKYSNKEKGLEVSLPFNHKWGYPNFLLNPYDETEDKVLFGSLHETGFCCGSWGSDEKLEYIPYQNKEDTIQRLEKKYSESEEIYTITSLEINEKEVIEYEIAAVCGQGGTIIIGEKYNYRLSMTCTSNTREDIISSMKFI